MQLGISAEPSDALEVARAKIAGLTPYTQVELLSLGFFASEEVPVGLVDTLRQADIATTIHPVELNLADTPSPKVVSDLDRWVEELDPLWLEQDGAQWLAGQRTYLGAQIVTPPFTLDSAVRLAENAQLLSSRWGRNFLVENPPIFTNSGDLDFYTWFGHIHTSGADLTLDIGHAMGAQINLGEKVSVPGPDWPGWPGVRSIHLSGQRVLSTGRGPLWLDRHESVFSKAQVSYARRVLTEARGGQALTLEMEGADAQTVADNLAIASGLIEREPAHV